MKLFVIIRFFRVVVSLRGSLFRYQFMATRSPDQTDVDAEMFYKLTYGMKSEEEKIEELQKRDNKHAGLITHSVPGF